MRTVVSDPLHDLADGFAHASGLLRSGFRRRHRAHLFPHRLLDLRRTHRLGRTILPASLLRPQADVVSVPPSGFIGVARHHRHPTVRAIQQPAQRTPFPAARLPLDSPPALQTPLHLLPLCELDNAHMFPRVSLAPMPHLSRVREAVENHRNTVLRERHARMLTASSAGPLLRGPSPPVQLLSHCQHTLPLLVERESLSDYVGFPLVHYQPPASSHHLITQRRTPSHPLSLASRRRHLVSRPLADQLSFELREAEKHVQRQPPDRRGCVELLRDRNEAR